MSAESPQPKGLTDEQVAEYFARLWEFYGDIHTQDGSTGHYPSSFAETAGGTALSLYLGEDPNHPEHIDTMRLITGTP